MNIPMSWELWKCTNLRDGNARARTTNNIYMEFVWFVVCFCVYILHRSINFGEPKHLSQHHQTHSRIVHSIPTTPSIPYTFRAAAHFNAVSLKFNTGFVNYRSASVFFHETFLPNKYPIWAHKIHTTKKKSAIFCRFLPLSPILCNIL